MLLMHIPTTDCSPLLLRLEKQEQGNDDSDGGKNDRSKITQALPITHRDTSQFAAIRRVGPRAILVVPILIEDLKSKGSVDYSHGRGADSS